MTRFIDFIRHGNAVLPEGETNDRDRILSPLGIMQAQAFGRAHRQTGKLYDHVIISGVKRTRETSQCILNVLGPPCQIHVVPEMFDPKEPTVYSERRNELYTKLGPASLDEYHDGDVQAMTKLGLDAAEKLKPIFREYPDGNALVIGHGVYTNQIILDTFTRVLSGAMMNMLFRNSALAECAGYRLVFDDDDKLNDMIDLPPIEVATI